MLKRPLAGRNLSFDDIVSQSGPGDLTVPGPRPPTFQTANNFQITVPANQAVPLTPGQFASDTIIIDVPSATGNSVFFGYGSQISLTSGLEVRPGLPLIMSADSYREMWELQRPLEIIASVVQKANMGQYRAPRVVFDASQFYLVASVQTVVAIMLFPPNDN